MHDVRFAVNASCGIVDVLYLMAIIVPHHKAEIVFRRIGYCAVVEYCIETGYEMRHHTIVFSNDIATGIGGYAGEYC